MDSCRLSILRSDQDWDAREPAARSVEAGLELNPWANWAYIRECWATFDRDRPVVMAECIRDGAALPQAYALWRIERDKRRFKPMCLRVFDFVMFMRTVPVVASDADMGWAMGVLAGSRRELRKATGADWFSSHRMTEASVASMQAALGEKGIRSYRTLFTPGQQVVVGDDIGLHLKSHNDHEIRSVEKERRRARNRWRCDPLTEVVNCGALPEAELASVFDRLERIQARTWQNHWEAESGRVDMEKTRLFRRRVFTQWARRGWLWMHFVTIAGEDVAYTVNVVEGKTAWVLFVGYAQEYRSYGFGKLAWVETMRHWHPHGVRVFELGGEVLGWKEAWATQVAKVYQLEWSLGGIKGLAIGTVETLKQIRRGSREKAVRAAASPPKPPGKSDGGRHHD